MTASFMLSDTQLAKCKRAMTHVLSEQMKILHYLASELKEEEGDVDVPRILTPKRAREFLQILEGEADKLASFDVVLAVVGTMKAGKSTTINAIIGKEILPNRNRPMTALPTLICHNSAQSTPRLTLKPGAVNAFLVKVRQYLPLWRAWVTEQNLVITPEMEDLVGFIEEGGAFLHEYYGQDAIFLALARFNDLVRLTKSIGNFERAHKVQHPLTFPFDRYTNFRDLPCIDVAFDLPQDAPSQGRFMLLDTAGPNESGFEELQNSMCAQLERASAVLLVLDYTQLGSVSEAFIRAQINDMPTIGKDRLFVAINKCDQKTAHSDTPEQSRTHVYHHLLLDKVHCQNVYPISARRAYLGRAMVHALPARPAYGDWVQDFACEVYGARKSQALYEAADSSDLMEDALYLFHESKMDALLTHLVGHMQQNAPYVAMQSALSGSSEVFDSLHNVLSIKTYFAKKQQLTQDQIDALKVTVERLRAQIQNLNQEKLRIHSTMDTLIRNIEKNVKLSDKVHLIQQKTARQIELWFAEESAQIDEQIKQLDFDQSTLGNVKEMSRQAGMTLNAKARDVQWAKALQYLLSNQKIANQRREALDALRSRAQASSDTLVFATTDELHAFEREIASALSEFVDNILVQAFYGLMQQSEQEARILIDSINQDCEKVLAGVLDEFRHYGMELMVSFDPSANLAREKKRFSGFSIPFTRTRIQDVRDQDGALGSLKRMAGRIFGATWGTYQVDYTTHTVNKKRMISHIMYALEEEVIAPLTRQVEEESHRLLLHSLDYIDQFEQRVSRIIGEMSKAIDNDLKSSLEAKRQSRDTLLTLKQKSDHLSGDFAKLSRIFLP